MDQSGVLLTAESWEKLTRESSSKRQLRQVYVDLVHDSFEILRFEFIPKTKHADDVDFCCAVLKRVKEITRKNRPGMWRGGHNSQTETSFFIRIMHYLKLPQRLLLK